MADQPAGAHARGGAAGAGVAAGGAASETAALVGKVCCVLDNHELVINLGSAHGVERGMCFAVGLSDVISIRDPDSDAFLGYYDSRQRVWVRDVQARLAICRTDRPYWSRPIAIGAVACQVPADSLPSDAQTAY